MQDEIWGQLYKSDSPCNAYELPHISFNVCGKPGIHAAGDLLKSVCNTTVLRQQQPSHQCRYHHLLHHLILTLLLYVQAMPNLSSSVSAHIERTFTETSPWKHRGHLGPQSTQMPAPILSRKPTSFRSGQNATQGQSTRATNGGSPEWQLDRLALKYFYIEVLSAGNGLQKVEYLVPNYLSPPSFNNGCI